MNATTPQHLRSGGQQPIAWHHLDCAIPAAWEPARYAIEARAGRIEFVERRAARAVVSWEPCAREPDRRTTLLDYLRARVLELRPRASFAPAGVHTAEHGRFLTGWHDDLPQVQALAWLPETRVLLRWIFDAAQAGGTPAPWIDGVLRSYRPNAEPVRRYRLFGLHVHLPARYEIERMAVYPANVMIAFEGSDKRRVTCRRWGLPEHLLGKEPLDRFYSRILAADGAGILAAEPARVGPHEACRLRYRQRPVHQMERYFGRGWTDGEAILWHDRDEARLHACEQIGPERSPPLAFNEILPAAGPVISERST